jgi:hypothetical protein
MCTIFTMYLACKSRNKYWPPGNQPANQATTAVGGGSSSSSS